ncbi:hypothetical protein THASP1DRAFT_27250 [Thamnocephalis sphaerospora]|uniref:GAT domain-containing protein n=1 Tax=Thamnocephalis sphaerospora TaxID=78915 RepID=A0A4P9XXA9_9FUNG|nr:hypothetical protein THASP1DRAFT_27250 [Thamnocephalis sphaerospora]|eukprot:RKP11005.1 hypothetical protein THASP1DRAFT_27250 [Thamnocephalis sphaerospora]
MLTCARQSMVGECKASQVKIQKMLTDNEDGDNTERLLLLNDMILDVIQKHANLRRGVAPVIEPAAKPPPAEMPSLIDMGMPEDEAQGRSAVAWGAAAATTQDESSAKATETVSTLDDLLGLTFDDASTPSAELGQIALPIGSPPSSTSGFGQGLMQPLVALPASGSGWTQQAPLKPTVPATTSGVLPPSSTSASPSPLSSQAFGGGFAFSASSAAAGSGQASSTPGASSAASKDPFSDLTFGAWQSHLQAENSKSSKHSGGNV